jgi:thiosulfate reductase / polysulfide reductase chain A
MCTVRCPIQVETEHGEGKWRTAGWDEALDYVAEKLKGVTDQNGARSIAFSDRGGLAISAK